MNRDNLYKSTPTLVDGAYVSATWPDKSVEENALNLKCSVHKEECSEFIDLSLSTQNTRVCFLCISQFKIPFNKVLPIRQLFSSSLDNFLESFSVLEDQQLIDSVSSNKGSVESKRYQYERFFENLKSAIETTIEKARKSQKLKLDQLAVLYKKTQDCYKDVSKIDEFRAQFLANPEENNKKFRKYVQTYVQQSQPSSIQVQAKLMEFLRFRDSFSLKQPEQIIELANNLIGQLDLFLGSPAPSINFATLITPLPQEYLKPSPLQVTPDEIDRSESLSRQIEELRIQLKNFQVELSEKLKQQEDSLKELQPQYQDQLNQQLEQIKTNPVIPPPQAQKISIFELEDGRYEGEIIMNNVRHGQGIFVYLNGDKYEGEWRDGLKNGQGKYIWADKDRYEGEFKDDKCEGQGKYFYKNGNNFVGEYKNGKRNGTIYHYDSSGKLISQYEYKDGKLL